jgi:haloacetate dehalogenase
MNPDRTQSGEQLRQRLSAVAAQEDSLWPQGERSISVKAFDTERSGVRLRLRVVVSDAPHASALLLLHGHPQTSVLWHRVAPGLAQHFHLVMLDLRGYGDSARPADDAEHVAYSKREMANDAAHAMRSLGFDTFAVLAHDRGARVAHRLAADHAACVSRMMLLDIAPTLAMYEHAGMAFAATYWHWFFLVQNNGLPEALVEADPVRYLRACMGSRRADGLAVFDPRALAQYERCIALEGSARGICGDYKASFGIDLAHDRADVAASRRINVPVHVLWGANGAVGKNFDVLGLWRERASQVSGQAVPCSHYIAEELPDTTLEHALSFFRSQP